MKYSPYIDPSLVLDLFPRGYLIWSGWDHIFSTVRFPIFLHKNLVPNRFQHWSSYFFQNLPKTLDFPQKQSFQKHWISKKTMDFPFSTGPDGLLRSKWIHLDLRPVCWWWTGTTLAADCRSWGRRRPMNARRERGRKQWRMGCGMNMGWTWDEHGFLGMNIWWFGMIWDEHWD